MIILDLNMPRMNGLELLEELRKDDALADSPVLVLTTSDLDRDVSAAFQSNVSGYFVKSGELAGVYETIAATSAYWSQSRFPARESRARPGLDRRR